MYENVQTNLALVLLFVRTELEGGKRLLAEAEGLISREFSKLRVMCFCISFYRLRHVRGERNGSGKREKRPKKIGRREKGRKKNRETGEPA